MGTAAGDANSQLGGKGSQTVNYNDRKTGYQHIPVDGINSTVGPAINALLQAVKNDNRLKNKKWQQESGTSVVSESGSNVHEMEFVETPLMRSTDTWNAELSIGSQFHGLKSSLQVTNASQRKVQVSMNNYFVRYLAGYIQFYEADGTPISDSSWQPNDQDWGYAFAGQYDNFRYLGLMSPIATALAIPIYSNPGSAEVSFTFPENATSARLCGCGLAAQGSNDYPKKVIPTLIVRL